MSDPIIKAAVDLKKELADVKSPEAQEAMNEIMKLLLACIEGSEEQKKS